MHPSGWIGLRPTERHLLNEPDLGVRDDLFEDLGQALFVISRVAAATRALAVGVGGGVDLQNIGNVGDAEQVGLAVRVVMPSAPLVVGREKVAFDL